jgi:hypothetical protein
MMLLRLGIMSKELANYNTKLLAEQARPKLDGPCSEWPHHRWPRPMDAHQRAEVPAFLPAAAE